MKQPELGRKIAELREARRLTQEELVDKCNISIRTIQRIEAGEVTPRTYTLKTIMAGLGYELDELSVENNAQENSPPLQSFFLTGGTISNGSLVRQLHLAWIFGIGYFVLRFFEGMAEFSIFFDDGTFSERSYMLIKLGILLTFICFQYGFMLLGALYKKPLLKGISMVLIVVTLLVVGADIASFYLDFISTELLILLYALAIGATRVVFGLVLLRLPRSLGRAPKLAGGLELIAACFSLTVVLSFLSPIMLIPAELLEIIILYNATQRIQQETKLHFKNTKQMPAG